MNPVSMLEQLQTAAVTALSADPMFSGNMSANGAAIPIILERKNDIMTQIETALGQVGICALVMTPLFEFFQQYDRDLSGWALLMVSVFEDVSLNQSPAGTGIRAIALAQEVLAVLHHQPTGLPTGPAGKPAAFIGVPRPFELTNEGPPLQYAVSFQAHVLLP
jgi:hypothetical protein